MRSESAFVLTHHLTELVLEHGGEKVLPPREVLRVEGRVRGPPGCLGSNALVRDRGGFSGQEDNVKPRWALFDLNGTLLDPGGVGEPLSLSREGSLAALDEALLGSMAETLSGSYRPLSEFLRAALVRRAGIDSGIDEAMERAKRMPPYPDCAAALQRLRSAGISTGVLTNSPRDTAERGLETAGLIGLFDLVMGSDEVEAFKPDPRVYQLGVERTGAAVAEICMVASHWWDLMGAARAGMRTAWVKRDGRELMQAGPAPDFQAAALDELAVRLSS